MDDFMEYMLLFDDEEEGEPKQDKRSGCGCLPMTAAGILLLALIFVFSR